MDDMAVSIAKTRLKSRSRLWWLLVCLAYVFSGSCPDAFDPQLLDLELVQVLCPLI
jgi:hypothetical protein